jgi:GxxExxY protein
MDANPCAPVIIGAAIEEHRHLGIGVLESAYEAALAIELAHRGLHFERQIPLPAHYKGVDLGDAYRLDLLVEGVVIVEIKALARLAPIHTAQLLTYLRLSERKLGLLLNFHAESMREGIRRIANDL